MNIQTWGKDHKISSISALKLLGIISFWEFIIMFVLARLQLGNEWLETLIDTGSLTILSGASIWFFILLPEMRKTKSEVTDLGYFLEQNLDAISQISIVSMTDLHGKIVYANDLFCQISGYSREELMGKDHRILNSGKHPKELFREMWSTIQSGQVWKGTVCNKNKKGGFYWVKAHIVPILDSNGNITNYISYRFDITAEVDAAEQLEQEKIKNIHLSRLSALGEMAGGIAHEVNNPLAIVNGMLSILERKIQSQNLQEEVPKLRESIQASQKQIQRITKIITGLKNFSRSEENQEKELVSTALLLENVATLCTDKLASFGILMEFKNAEFFLQGNSVQLEQVLVNLINNSIDAVQSLPQKWIHIEVRKLEEFVEIAVLDSGLGIPQVVADKIMQPFFTTKEIGKGTGLGLSISHGIIKNHGGTLELDRRSSNTRFVIHLPAIKSNTTQIKSSII